MYGDLEEPEETSLHWTSEPKLVRLMAGASIFMISLWITPFILGLGGRGVSWWSIPVLVTGLIGVFIGFVIFINGLYYRSKDGPFLRGCAIEGGKIERCSVTYKGEVTNMVREHTNG